MSCTTGQEVVDGFRERIERALPKEKPKGSVVRPDLPNRQVVNGILSVLRSGCQWKGIKQDMERAAVCTSGFKPGTKPGCGRKIYQVMVKFYHKKSHVQWIWQTLDNKRLPAPLGGEETSPNPTDQAKSASKRHPWVDQ